MINSKPQFWIAVYTKPRHEKKVANKLIEKKYTTYLPLLKERRKWSDRKKWVEFPLFKSYLFVYANPKLFYDILKTPGLVRIIKFGGEIAEVSEKTIKTIKLMLEGDHKPIATDYFIKGDYVTVKEGPLKGMNGEITKIDNQDHLIFRIESIQHSISVKINRSYLSKKVK